MSIRPCRRTARQRAQAMAATQMTRVRGRALHPVCSYAGFVCRLVAGAFTSTVSVLGPGGAALQRGALISSLWRARLGHWPAPGDWGIYRAERRSAADVASRARSAERLLDSHAALRCIRSQPRGVQACRSTPMLPHPRKASASRVWPREASYTDLVLRPVCSCIARALIGGLRVGSSRRATSCAPVAAAPRPCAHATRAATIVASIGTRCSTSPAPASIHAHLSRGYGRPARSSRQSPGHHHRPECPFSRCRCRRAAAGLSPGATP